MKLRSILFFLLVCCFTGNIHAQDQQKTEFLGIVMGNVITAESKAVAGATVAIMLSNDSTKKLSLLTDKNGAFEFDNLPLGVYRLQVKALGFNTLTLDSINIRAERYDFNL